MTAGIIGVVVDGDGTSTERRCAEGGQIGIGGEATSVVGEVGEPIDESGIDLSLGEASTNGGIVGASYGEWIWRIHGEGSGTGNGLTAGVGSGEGNGYGTSARVGRGECGQVGSIYIASSGETKLGDPVVPFVIDVLL